MMMFELDIFPAKTTYIAAAYEKQKVQSFKLLKKKIKKITRAQIIKSETQERFPVLT